MESESSSEHSFVIVDRCADDVERVRRSLLEAGAKVHVFDSYAGALILLQRKKVDAVVVGFVNDKATVDFCNSVRAMNIAVVYSTPHAEPQDPRTHGFEITFSRRRESPTIFVPYRGRRAPGGACENRPG